MKRLPLGNLHPAPWNPRLIKDKRFAALKKSIQNDPEFMQLRPILATKDGTILRSECKWYKLRNMTTNERFWAKVKKGDGCWEWQAAIKDTGYGVFQIGKWQASKLVKAHRYAWELTNGAIPDGLWVLHKCDNPKCVRPDHLFLGDAFTNMNDCAAKGRLGSQVHPEARPRGERHWKTKFTQKDVDSIRMRRDSGEMITALASEYGVDRHTISNIFYRRTWR